MAEKFKKGDQVLIATSSLHGVTAVVVAEEDGDYICRISEHQYEGHLVQFSAEQLHPVQDLQRERAKKDPKAKHILEEHPTARLPWPEKGYATS